ncbi:MAG: hypothetical protein ABI321_18215 [Polyangia bacterium]
MIGRWIALSSFALFLVSCGAAPNTQYLPIGQRCTHPGDCGTTPFECDDTKPGGYCAEPCVTDGSCPTDSVCVNKTTCRRKCSTNADCRQTEGYACVTGTEPISPYCDTP